MLPMINLTPADPTSLTEGSGQSAGLRGASTTPEGSFSDLLRGPIMVAVGEPFGESLPETGKGLPLPDPQSLVGRFPGGWQETSESASDTDPLIVLRSGETLTSAAERTVTDVAERTAIPALVAPLVDEQNRQPRTPIGLAADPTSMLEGEAAEDPLPSVAARAVQDAAARASGTTVERPLPVSAEQRTVIVPATPADSVPVAADQAPGLTGASAAAPATPANGASPFVPQAALTTPNQAPAAPVMETAIGLPVQDAAWSDSLGERVVFMSGNRIQNAEIRLTPAELGPIRVSVALEDGAANVTFSAQHVTTREAIEAALPRLREMLAEQGLSLGNANVADQGPNPESDGSTAADERELARAATESERDAVLTAEELKVSRRAVRGLVDTFV